MGVASHTRRWRRNQPHETKHLGCRNAHPEEDQQRPHGPPRHTVPRATRSPAPHGPPRHTAPRATRSPAPHGHTATRPYGMILGWE